MHITTFSKVQMNPLCPKQEEIRIEDIAHAQSLMTRANGHFPEFIPLGNTVLLVPEKQLRETTHPE